MAVKAGEKALVLREETRRPDFGEEIHNFYFNESFTLETPIPEGEMINSWGQSIGGEMVDCQIDFDTYFCQIRIMLESGNIDVMYESSDGINYNYVDFRWDDWEQGINISDIGTEIIIPAFVLDGDDERVLSPFQIRSSEFQGLFVAKEEDGKMTWKNQPLGLNVDARKVLPSVRYYDDTGFHNGEMGDIQSTQDLINIDEAVQFVTQYQPDTMSHLYDGSNATRHNTLQLIDQTKTGPSGVTYWEYDFLCYNNPNLEYFDFDLIRPNNSVVKRTSMIYAFAECPNLTYIDHFCEGMNRMMSPTTSGLLSGDYNLELDLTDLKIENLGGISSFFKECSKLVLDMSLYDWSTVQSYDYAFCGTEEHAGPTLLNLDKWTPSSNTTTLARAFEYNPSIVNFVMDNCTMPNCSQVSRVCYHCDNLETFSMKNLALSSTNSNIYLDSMLAYCPKLKTVDCSGWGSTKAHNYPSLFRECTSLESIIFDHRCLETKWVNDISYMCYNCTSLKFADFRGIQFTHADNRHTDAFTGVPADCLIIVGTDADKTSLSSFFPHLTNIKTVAEYEG